MGDKIGWLSEPEEHNYPAALSYLELLFPTARAAEVVEKLKAATPVIIADGYHRMCAVYAVDEDALIPCKIV
jgi:hypothetical protein